MYPRPLRGVSLVTGQMGCGKTLFSVIAAARYARAGKRIWANFDINLQNTSPVRSVLDLQKVRDGLLILDESYLFADSRRAMSNRNLATSTILMGSRKRDFDVIVITQVLSAVDPRIRLVAKRRFAPNLSGSTLFVRRFVRDVTDEREVWMGRGVMRLRVGERHFALYDTSAPVYDYLNVEAGVRAAAKEAEKPQPPTLTMEQIHALRERGVQWKVIAAADHRSYDALRIGYQRWLERLAQPNERAQTNNISHNVEEPAAPLAAPSPP
jgi:hypothetical protein